MNRLAIFMHWDKDSIIDAYVITYLKGLLEVCDDIIFVSNCPNLSQKEKNKIVNYTSHIFTRENSGLDFAAWKYVIDEIGYNFLDENYDEIILANDSCFAPLFPFKTMFNKMESENYDLWGCTEYKSDKYFASHIQSYFLVINRAVFTSNVFQTFFSQVNINCHYDEVVLHYESRLSNLLDKNGFRCGVFIDHKKINEIEIIKHNNYSVINWFELLEFNCPFLKRKSFQKDSIINSKNMFRKILSWKKMIKRKGSTYNSNEVTDYYFRQSSGSNFLFKNLIILFLYFTVWIQRIITVIRIKLKIRTRIKKLLKRN